VNWIVSKEGLEIYARPREGRVAHGYGRVVHLRRGKAKDGIKYFDTYDWQFTVTEKEKSGCG
jgi:hypothetical protein